MLASRPSRRRAETGAAAVEFALIAPLLLVLVFAIISYGYMLSFRQAISQGAAEGARAAAVTPGGLANPDLVTRARQAVSQPLKSYGVSCANSSGGAGSLTHDGSPAGTCKIDLAVSCSGSTTGAKCVRVTLDYRYRDNSLLPNVGFGVILPSHLTYVSEVQVS